MENNDVLHIAGGGFGIYNTAQSNVEEAVPRVLQTLQMEASRGFFERMFLLAVFHCAAVLITECLQGLSSNTPTPHHTLCTLGALHVGMQTG